MSDHKSVIARLGQIGQKYTDPLAWAFGRKYTDKLVDIADFSNKQLSSVVKPFAKVDKTLNPLRRFNVVPGVNKVKEWTEAKPADTGAIVAGGYFAGGALGGGAGSSGYGAAGSGATGTTGAGATGAGAGVAGGAAEVLPEVVVTGTTGNGTAAAVGAGAGAGGETAANSNGDSNNWRDQMQMPGQQDDSEQARAEDERRQLELMMEQERLRREAFRRNQIARAMG
jgi:hypothetical protein